MISKTTFRQFLSSSSILLLNFLYGCKVAYTQSATALFMSLNTPFTVTAEEISWIGSVSYSGTIISMIVCYAIGNKIGRKAFIIGCILTYITAWLLIWLTSSGVIIIVSLLFYGIAASMHMIIGCIYFGETATPKNRETLGILYGLAMHLGIQVEYPISSLDNYRLLVVFPLILSVLALLLCVMFMAESPYYLVSKDRIQEATVNSSWLNSSSWNDDDVARHISNVKLYTREQKNMNISSVRTIFLPTNFKLLILMVYLCCATSFNSPSILVYGSLVISPFLEMVSGTWFVNVYNVMGLVAALISLATIKIFSRRALLLYGFLSTCALLLLCALCYYIEMLNDNKIAYMAVVIEILLISLAFISVTALGAGLLVLKTEVFPQKLKEFYMSTVAFTSDLTAFMVSQTYFHCWSRLGMHSLLTIYALVNIVALLLAFFFVSDTQNKSLYQIRTEYVTDSKNNKPTTHSVFTEHTHDSAHSIPSD